jgi:hypothetical protein
VSGSEGAICELDTSTLTSITCFKYTGMHPYDANVIATSLASRDIFAVLSTTASPYGYRFTRVDFANYTNSLHEKWLSKMTCSGNHCLSVQSAVDSVVSTGLVAGFVDTTPFLFCIDLNTGGPTRAARYVNPATTSGTIAGIVLEINTRTVYFSINAASLHKIFSFNYDLGIPGDSYNVAVQIDGFALGLWNGLFLM